MKDESSDARNAAAAAISVASPKRPMGMCTSRRAARSGSLANNSCSNGVFTGPGHSALTAHALPGELDAELPRHGEHAALRRRVADLARRRAHDGHERGRVDDRPFAAGQQVRQGVLAAQVHRRQVDALHALPRIESRFEDRVVVGRADAGVVAADVDPPVVAGHLGVEGFHFVGGRHIGLDEHAAHRSRHRTAGLLVEVNDGDRRTFAGEALAHRPPDPAGSSGDDRHPPNESTGIGGRVGHVCLSLLRSSTESCVVRIVLSPS